MEKILMCDMDGTLTPARKSATLEMLQAIDDMIAKGFKLAIVSGSTLEYIREQMTVDWLEPRMSNGSVIVMPCNGTQCYTENEEKYKLDLKKHVGEEAFKNLMQLLLLEQAALRPYPFPWTGDHISYRGSTLNFCPVGRNANDQDRDSFKSWDCQTNYRDNFVNSIQRTELGNIFKFKVGGNTSVDIYPIGWDKSYAFRYFERASEIYYIGDRCGPAGNDYEAIQAAGNNGFVTTGPDQTLRIFSEILSRSASKSQI